jgi:hypothetical protein
MAGKIAGDVSNMKCDGAIDSGCKAAILCIPNLDISIDSSAKFVLCCIHQCRAGISF